MAHKHTSKIKVMFEEEDLPSKAKEATSDLEGQFALLQCPQCGGWFTDSFDRAGEACPACFEGWQEPKGGAIS